MNNILPFNILFTFLCCHRHGISKAIAWFPRSRAGGRRWRRGRGYSSTSSFSTSTTFSSTFTKSLCFTSSESSTSNNHNWFHYSIHCSSITFRDMRQKKMKADCSSFLSSTIFRLHIVNYFCQCNPSLQTEELEELYFQPLHISHCVHLKKHLGMKMWQKHLYCQELLSDAGILLYAHTFNVYIFILYSYNFHPKFCKSILSFTYLYHMSKDLYHMSKDLYVQINVASLTQRE